MILNIATPESEHFNNAFIIAEGKWNDNISWEFIVSNELPDRNLCTAVCCVLTFNNSLVLIRNSRGWEFPGGNIEPEETIEDALIREVREEACVTIENPKLFGFKKLTAIRKAPRRDNPSLFYPFPNSYVAFFYAEVWNLLQSTPEDDVEDIIIVNYPKAKTILAYNNQYEGILEYLIAIGLLFV